MNWITLVAATVASAAAVGCVVLAVVSGYYARRARRAVQRMREGS